MKRRGFLRAVIAAAVLLAALPKPASASPSMDSYFVSAFDRIVAPVATNLVRPKTLERADANPYWFTTFNAQLSVTQVSYAHGTAVPWSDYEAVHESGHAFAILLSQRYPGDWIADFLSYHGYTKSPDTLPQFSEIFAEHFAAALGMTPYLGYPQYKGLVPFRSAADTRAWIVRANQMSVSVVMTPPIAGAKYAGASADQMQVFWLYPDGSIHTWIGGQQIQ